jgi:hypothetical protein
MVEKSTGSKYSEVKAGVAHLRQVKRGKKTSLDYKVLPTVISHPGAVIGADTYWLGLGHGSLE